MPFPAQNVHYLGFGTNRAPQRREHSGAGDRHQSAKQKRQTPGQRGKKMRGYRNNQPIDEHAEQNQVAGHARLVTVMEINSHP